MDSSSSPSPTLVAALGPGVRLDRYELVAPVGQGGMGAVWLARVRGKHGFEKFVAIKTILPRLSRDPALRALFLEEARLAARVEHANVAQILDLGEAEASGLLYLVLEWVDGRALDAVMAHLAARRVELPVAYALRIAADACAGLHAAHSARDRRGAPMGLVHCDVSPQNLLIDERGIVKVIDFGIARARQRSLADEAHAGTVRGKVGYIAPEQARAQQVDARADVFGMGAVLYEMLAGRPPFASMAELAELVAGRRQVAPLPARVPPDASAVVMRALELLPEDRFQTAHQMRNSIEQALVAAGTPTTNVDVAELIAAHLPQDLSRTLGDEQAPFAEEPYPLSTPPDRVSIPSIAARAVSSAPGSSPAGRVLLLDPDGDAGPLARALAAEHPPPITVSSVEAALIKLRHAPIDVVLVRDTVAGARGFLRVSADVAPGAARVLVGEGIDPAGARAVLLDVDAHALVAAPFTRDAIVAAAVAARARARGAAQLERELDDAGARSARLADEEAALRRSIDDLTGALDDVRRASAHADNAARVGLIGASEARRADACGRPLTALVYRMRRPSATIPVTESAIVYSALTSAAAVVTEAYGELIAVVPGEGARAVEARLDHAALSLGVVGVGELADGESFAALVERVVARVGGRGRP